MPLRPPREARAAIIKEKNFFAIRSRSLLCDSFRGARARRESSAFIYTTQKNGGGRAAAWTASRRFAGLIGLRLAPYATKFLTSSIDAGFAERAIVPFFISMIAGSSAMPSFSTSAVSVAVDEGDLLAALLRIRLGIDLKLDLVLVDAGGDERDYLFGLDEHGVEVELLSGCRRKPPSPRPRRRRPR